MGKDKSRISRYRNAATVYKNCCDDATLLEKTEHLAAEVYKVSQHSDGLLDKGLKGYAQEVKKAASTITEVRNAAKVFHQIRLTEFDIDLPSLYDKATHLLQISKAPGIKP